MCTEQCDRTRPVALADIRGKREVPGRKKAGDQRQCADAHVGRRVRFRQRRRPGALPSKRHHPAPGCKSDRKRTTGWLVRREHHPHQQPPGLADMQTNESGHHRRGSDEMHATTHGSEHQAARTTAVLPVLRATKWSAAPNLKGELSSSRDIHCSRQNIRAGRTCARNRLSSVAALYSMLR